MTSNASDYRAAADQLDQHMACCPSCSTGTACPTGDDTAEAEFRAWRDWQRTDPAGTRAHQRDGFTWTQDNERRRG